MKKFALIAVCFLIACQAHAQPTGPGVSGQYTGDNTKTAPHMRGLSTHLNIKRSVGFWNIYVEYKNLIKYKDDWIGSFELREIEEHPASVAWEIFKASLIDGGHILFEENPELKVLNVDFIMVEFISNEKLVEHVIFSAPYTRDMDAKWSKVDVNQMDIKDVYPDRQMSDWFSQVIALENANLRKPKEPSAMSVDDFMLDAQSLKNSKIRVKGYTSCAPGNINMCMIYDDPSNFIKNIWYDASLLSHDDRSRLLDCNIMTSCFVTLEGIVKLRPLDMIDASKFFWGRDEASSDQLAPEPPAPKATDVMTVKDFILDHERLIRHEVTVAGSAQCDGSSCWLSQREMLSQQVVRFDGSQLSRDDRKRLLDCNQAFSAGCTAVIKGFVDGNGDISTREIYWR